MVARFRHMEGSSVVLLSSLSSNEFMRRSLISVQFDIRFPYQYILTFLTGALLSNFVIHSNFGSLLPCAPPPYEYESTIRNRHSPADQFGIHGSSFLLLPSLLVNFANSQSL